MKKWVLVLFYLLLISCKTHDENKKQPTKLHTSDVKILDSKFQGKRSSAVAKTKLCEFNNLSSKYKFAVEACEYTNEKEQKYPISAWIIITDKKSAKSQEIHFEPNSWSTYADLPCSSFFVRDFNFDGLEDFAIVWDEGGNVGKLYEYYFQDKNGSFSPTNSFPLQHGMLAENVDVTKKTITSQSVVGCCHMNINKYKLNSNGNWDTSSEQQELKKN